MYKHHLRNSIVKELKICKRLYTKIPADKMNFQPREGMRTTWELLQYVTIVGTVTLRFWLQEMNGDPTTFFAEATKASKEVPPERFLSVMDVQIETVNRLFDQLPEDELYSREVAYTWGGTAPLGEALIQTSLKQITAYKMQLFLYLKMSTDLPLGTPDAWLLTDMEEIAS